MMKHTFINTRFDPDLTPFHDLAKNMAQAFGYTADLAVDKQLAQLLRLRVAQYNRCSYCVILHSQTARDIGIDPVKVDNLISWQESQLYSHEERVALAYTEALCDGHLDGFEQVHQHLAKHFSEKEVAEIAAIVINMNVWTRLKLATGQVPTYQDE